MRNADDDDESSEDALYSVVMLGDAGVGKTTFFLAVRDERVPTSTMSTVGCEFAVRKAQLFNGQRNVTVQLIDTAGQERFASLNRHYYKPADAAIIMFDVACESRASLDKAVAMCRDLRDYNKRNAVVRFVGNKEDLLDAERAEDIRESARRYLERQLGAPLDAPD